MEQVIIRKATFSKKVITYIFFVVLFYLLIFIITIPLIIVWVLGFGQWLSKVYFKTLTCTLTNKNLQFSKGLLLHIEKTIPLENIQDLSFIGGPILRAFDLTLIKVETAGGGGPRSNNIMSIIGIEDAVAFKEEILKAREAIVSAKYLHQPLDNKPEVFDEMLATLKDIKELLNAN